MKEKQSGTSMAYKGIVLVLVLVALSLGYLILKQKYPQLLQFAQKPAQPSKAPEKKDELVARPDDSYPKGTTAEQKLLLNPPSTTASKEVKEKHYALVTKNAVEAEDIELNKCELPTPLVYKLIGTDEFKVKNTDTVEHTLHMGQDIHYKIAPNDTTTVKGSFKFGQGAYGYGCDTKIGVIGFILYQP